MYATGSKATLGGMTIPLLPDRDGDCTANLRLALSKADAEVVEIDLEHVPYLSSQALTELARFRRRHRGERIVLQRPNALVFRTLNIVGFNRLFAIEPAAA
jgi:anti-anti-sigma regulatory factor